MSKARGGFIRGLILTLCVFALLFAGAWRLLSYVGSASEEAQTAMVRDAVRSAALTCYAVEGCYPENVDYLREHYGLRYDADRYFIHYDAFASNIMPDIRVSVRGESGL